jgi:hypothetical protein
MSTQEDSIKAASSIHNEAKTINQANVADSQKWSAAIKEHLLVSSDVNKSNRTTPTYTVETLLFERVPDLIETRSPLSFQLESKVTEAGDGQRLKQQQISVYKSQMNTYLNSCSVSRDVDQWIDQAIKQTEAGGDWVPALKWIISKESGGDPNAQNPNSTAYGLMQFLDTTWGNYGYEKTADPVQQIVAGIDYIKQRYGTAENAKAFWQEKGWY